MPDTLAADAHHSLEIKHSRFVAQACALASPEQALEQVRRFAAVDATHNCWAYRYGQEYRSSDDGEPSGTAGRPILAAIDGQGYDRVVVVVTRWYGGIKLGAGGLVRAEDPAQQLHEALATGITTVVGGGTGGVEGRRCRRGGRYSRRLGGPGRGPGYGSGRLGRLNDAIAVG